MIDDRVERDIAPRIERLTDETREGIAMIGPGVPDAGGPPPGPDSGAQPYAFAIVTPVPIRWIGFTGATGGSVATFGVRDVTLRVCP